MTTSERWRFRRPHLSREAYSFLILTLISLFLDVVVVFIGFYSINANDHKFCQLMNASLAQTAPVQKPADPAAQPKQEKAYENYEIVVQLSRSLGCS